MATYKLTLKNLNNSGENSSVTLTYDAQGTAAKIKVDAKEVTCTLSEFNYSKEIYCPGKIWFRLQLGSTFDPSVIYKLFSSCTVQLSVGTFPVAENYRVFNIQLERKLKSSDVYVIVEAFSPDKFLTLDTYCKAYTGKKLVKEIIQNKEYWPDNVGSDLSQLVDVHPQFLEFAVTKTEETEDPNTHKKETQQVTTRYEFIQPYLVQYNESFFDFLVRVANRCGEFFYYEGGKIHVGWPRPDKDVWALTDNDLVHIDTYTSIRYMQRQTTAWNAASLADVHNDYTQAKTWMTTASPKMMRDSELAYDEHLAALPPKDKYTKWEDYAGWPEAFWISTVSDVFNQANLKDMIAYIMWDAPVALGTSKMSADSSNDDYEQTYFKKEAKEERGFKKDDEDWMCLYSTAPQSGYDVMCSLDFYKKIREGIETAEQSRIRVTLENNFYNISLGSLIYFEDKKDIYLVVKIEGAAVASTQQKSGQSLTFEAISFEKDSKKKVFPPAASVAPIRVSSPQRAFITHNSDPLKLGRVRVRYPWQGGEDDPSPWIRMAVPMASKDSGFKFLPEKGDEAIINYENGNVEKPYVEGMLYSSERQPPFAYKGKGPRTISSLNGHSIIFSDSGAGTNYLKTFAPIWGTVTTFFPSLKEDFPGDGVKKAFGGIELTDEYGLYSISMSSDKRSISIKSPLGKVGINAFTGITISAPNGNVKIQGKNVDIVAGNNLTLRSGTNRDFLPTSTKDAVKLAKGIGTSLAGNLTVVDLPTIRIIFETVLRPIAGTLRLSSKRYLCLEAGKGSAEIKGRRIVDNFKTKKNVIGSNGAGSFFKGKYTFTHAADNKVYTPRIPQALRDIISGCNTLFTSYKTRSQTVLPHFTIYEQQRTALKQQQDLDSLLKKTDIPDLKTVFDNAQKGRQPEQFEMKDDNDIPANIDANTRQVVNTAVTALNNAAASIYAQAYNEDTELDGAFAGNVKFVVKDAKVKKAIQKLYTPVTPATVVDKSLTSNALTALNVDPEARREAVYQALLVLVNNQIVEEGDRYYDRITAGGIGKPKSYEAFSWVKFVREVKKESSAKKYLKDIGSTLLPIDDLIHLDDQHVWDNTDDGKILFADTAGKTLDINQGALHTYMESEDLDRVLQAIQQVLYSV